MEILTVILDDDAHARAAARTALSEYGDIKIVGEFRKSGELFAFLENNAAHLLFLDIELDEELGFDAAGKLRRDYPGLMIVFLTGHSSYAIDGYDFQPVNFLTKPINPAKLRQAIEEVKRRMGNRKEPSSARLMFHLNQGYRIIDVRDICYIARNSRKNYLYTETETLHIKNYTMRDMEEMLAGHGFFLCHQSYIISLYRVTAVRDVGRQLYEAILRGCEKPVPIARGRYEELLGQLKSMGIREVASAIGQPSVLARQPHKINQF